MAKDITKDDPMLISRLRDPATVREAFGEVIKLYGEPLYWQIRRMVESHEDADDLLQNTFMKAWSSIDNFRGDAKLSTWLYKIAINESLTFLERERKRIYVACNKIRHIIMPTVAFYRVNICKIKQFAYRFGGFYIFAVANFGEFFQ